jgi:EmrB/QacA subfamily drug resistance transporter
MFATIALALLMSALDSTIVATALGSLQRDLHAPITWTGWTITAYSLGLMLVLMLSGRLSERYGRRRVFLVSVTVFTVASLLCGLAGNIYVLVLLRFIQALGGAGFTPSATGIIVDHFGPGRDKAVGLFGSIFPIGGMAGPVLGGIFVDYWSWRGIFFVNVPIGILLAVMCLRFVPKDTAASRRGGSVDVAGTVLLGFAVLGFMFVLNLVGQSPHAIATPLFAGCAIATVASLIFFGRHIRRSTHPIVPVRFIAGPGFGAVNIINVVYNGVVNAVVTLIPLYAVTRFHISALGAGTLLTAEAAAAIVISPLAVMALRRTGYRPPIYVGGAIMALGTFGLSLTPHAVSPYLWLAVSGCLIGIGAGIASPASRNAGLQLEPGRSSSLAALRTLGSQVGLIAAIAAMTAIISLANDAGLAQAHAYLVCAALMLLAMPVVSRVTEHRGSW